MIGRCDAGDVIALLVAVVIEPVEGVVAVDAVIDRRRRHRARVPALRRYDAVAFLPRVETFADGGVGQRRRTLGRQFAALRRQHGQWRTTQTRMFLLIHRFY